MISPAHPRRKRESSFSRADVATPTLRQAQDRLYAGVMTMMIFISSRGITSVPTPPDWPEELRLPDPGRGWGRYAGYLGQ